MSSTLFHTAHLDQAQLDDLQQLEQELGVTLVAMESSLDGEPAELDDDQLARIRALEEKTGKVLLAFN